MQLTNIVDLVNKNLAGELLTLNQMTPFLDQSIDEINDKLNTVYPAFSEFNAEVHTDYPDYNFFPDAYMRNVVCIGAAYYFYINDEEGSDSAPMYQRMYATALFRMERDYINQVEDMWRKPETAGYVSDPFSYGILTSDLYNSYDIDEQRILYPYIKIYEEGPPGMDGPKGDKGEPGVGINIITVDSNYFYIHLSDGTIKQIDRPTGVKGDQGEQGPKGDKGEQGIQGIQGPKGDKGDQGEQGSIGLKGDKGDKGDTGSKGDKGDPGSSYELPTTLPASMITGLPTSLPANGGDADTVSGFTVGKSVPANADFIDTITTINGKTGAITKADIVALGIPASDTNTVYTPPSTYPATMISVADAAGKFTATNVEGALTELFTNVNNGKGLIATAIVDKGGSASGSDSFTNLATEIANLPSGGIPDLIGTLTFTGNYATPTYFTESGCRMGCNANGDVFISVQSGTTSTYENINFMLKNIPSGVGLLHVPEIDTKNTYQTSHYGCVLTGVTGKLNVELEFSDRSMSFRYVSALIKATYA